MIHRLRARRSLTEDAQDRAGLRWWIIRHTPTVMIDNLLEILMAAATLAAGVVYLVGGTSTAIDRLPWWLVKAYAASLVMSALITWAGLLWRQYGTVLAYGLRAMGLTLGIYVLCLVGYVGFLDAPLPMILGVVFGALCLWRAFVLRCRYLVARDEVKAAGGGR